MEIVCLALRAYLLIVFARVILSWFPITPGSAMAGVHDFLRKLTDPVLEPLRRVIPPLGGGGMAIDLSPIIVFLVIQLLLIPLVC
ncbi:MAG: YggT family protein [Acidimicrobiales bacterium]